MKRILSILCGLLILPTFAALDTSTVSVAVNVSGNMSKNDKLAFLWIIAQENINRVANLGTNAVLLTTTNNADIKNSMQVVLSATVQSALADYRARAAQALSATLTADQIETLHSVVLDALINGGKTFQAITNQIANTP